MKVSVNLPEFVKQKRISSVDLPVCVQVLEDEKFISLLVRQKQAYQAYKFMNILDKIFKSKLARFIQGFFAVYGFMFFVGYIAVEVCGIKG